MIENRFKDEALKVVTIYPAPEVFGIEIEIDD